MKLSATKVSRKQSTRKVPGGNSPVVSRPVILNSKGGGEKWVKMAGAMDAALDRLRELYVRMEWCRNQSVAIPIVQDADGHTLIGTPRWDEILKYIGETANILKAGLKAR